MKKLIVIPALLVAIGGGTALAQTDLLGFAQSNPTITAEQAKAAALKEVKGKIVEFEYDGDDYRPHYELDIVAGNEKVEVYVDAKSGAVKVKEREIRGEFDDFDDDDDVNYLAQAKISTEQAIKIAKAKASGTVTKVKLDKDDHRLVYEIEIKNGQTEYEFDIDAQTGEIVKFEEDLED